MGTILGKAKVGLAVICLLLLSLGLVLIFMVEKDVGHDGQPSESHFGNTLFDELWIPTDLEGNHGNLSLGNNEVFLVNCKAGLYAPVIVGLLNRKGIFADCVDLWIKELKMKAKHIGSEDLLKLALKENLVSGKVLYEAHDHISENLAISVAGVFDLLPLTNAQLESLLQVAPMFADLPVKYDFRKDASVQTPGGYFHSYGDATNWVIANVLENSNRMKFTFRRPTAKLIPFTVMEKMVTVYVNEIEKKCIEFLLAPTSWLREFVASRNGLKPFLDLTSSAHWDQSKYTLTMMGFAPGIVEATGVCTRDRTMGVVASDIAESVALLKAMQTQTPELEVTKENPLKQSPFEKLVYDPNMIYVTHVVSDGDNLDLLHDTYKYLRMRNQMCQEEVKRCFPVTWTVSAATETISKVVRSYYDYANAPYSGDSFMLPPSGATYFYPGSTLDEAGLQRQRAHTLDAAEKLDVDATIVWDFFYKFRSTRHFEYIRSFIGTKIKAVFWSAAPWQLSPNEESPTRKLGYKSDQVLRDPNNPSKGVVVFSELTRWDGLNGKDTANGKHFSVAKMTSLINAQPKGSLNFVYDISWEIGPRELDKFHSYLVENDVKTIRLVDYRTLIDLAYQKYNLT